ncbi:hypothetical protein SAM23877_5656 [Streptomyces ambofaciens ATCC 23877]|uniref:Uncharacterized protein n=1 Tax=Streptomyces ambofaciens (strain ATCC 23877 / 3486 / DSM 40053 / JCM 4204 / NBRC 12836 / NRRL B-2516) TaxID=278992 RepID=A0A0K2B0N4_STRA7|nr:hypothetical protein SAM23877_5656 [Streptomyces ambofaciens ATCC 23877]
MPGHTEGEFGRLCVTGVPGAPFMGFGIQSMQVPQLLPEQLFEFLFAMHPGTQEYRHERSEFVFPGELFLSERDQVPMEESSGLGPAQLIVEPHDKGVLSQSGTRSQAGEGIPAQPGDEFLPQLMMCHYASSSIASAVTLAPARSHTAASPPV